jgi:hypothetical protein
MTRIKPKNKGKLHRDLGVPEDAPIPAGKLRAGKRAADPAVRRRAVFAENADHWHHDGARMRHRYRQG